MLSFVLRSNQKLRQGAFSAIANTTLSTSCRSVGTVAESPMASAAWQQSCYQEINFTIDESATAMEAVHKLAAFDIGCLVTLDADGHLAGIVSERDLVRKVALLDHPLNEIRVKQIATSSANLITVTPADPIQTCMELMVTHDIRHLPLVDDKNGQIVVGMLSIKDCAKALLEEQDRNIEMLTNLAAGKTGTFIVD